jgi:RNA polymerase sigma-70 factor, ECF subfamily
MLPDYQIRQVVEDTYRSQSRRVFATLVRLLQDFDLAEEAMHEAFALAVTQWADTGVPDNPRAWLVSTGRFKAIDALRRRGRFDELAMAIAGRLEEVARSNAERANHDIEDDRLRLIFTCCHPAIDPLVQVPLTLREVCGLTTEEVASAFLIAPATMAQRIVRGKAKIRDAGIPFRVPDRDELPHRIESVLAVCYLVFNEGYSASSGESHIRADLTSEAIRLGRLLCELIPDAEVYGLLALMLLHESRRPARTNLDGDLVLLEDQDRAAWNRELIREAREWLARALATGEVGSYTIQAAISAVHAEAGSAFETNWSQIAEWYDMLMQAAPSSIVELNRAVAVSMRDGPEAGLVLVDAILERGELSDYFLAHSARGELLRKLGRAEEAIEALERAYSLAKQEPERRFLRRKIEQARSQL